MKESIARLGNATFWWKPEATARYRELLEKAGPNAKEEMRLGLNKAGQLEVWRRVVREDGKAALVAGTDDDGWLNESLLCPPICGPG